MSSKFINRVTYTLIGLSIVGLITFSLSKIYSYYNTGATDPIFNVNSELYTKAPAEVTWLPDDNNIEGVMNKYLREEIAYYYSKAWQIKNLSIGHNKDLGLKEHFMPILSEKIKKEIGHLHTIEQTSLKHKLKLHFVSYDKQIVSFTDEAMVHHHNINTGDFQYTFQDTSQYKVLMTLDDGKWRINKLHQK